jgi:hypothetical protein
MTIDNNCVRAPLRYVVDDGVPPIMYVDWPEEEHKAHQPVYEEKIVTINNGRPESSVFKLSRHGFEFLNHTSNVKNFYDAHDVEKNCYHEVEKLVKEKIHCNEVIVFDHTLRTSNKAILSEYGVREPVKAVHNDYTEKSASQRVRDLLTEHRAEKALKRRFAIVQLWRPIETIETEPLAICDGRTIPEKGFITVERRYPHRTAEVFHISYNPEHKWIYFPQMTPEEALIFKVFDTDAGAGVKYTAHSAFEDPNSPSNAKPRESIEIRALALF